MQVNPVPNKPAVPSTERVEPSPAAHSFSDYLKGRPPPLMREKPDANRTKTKPEARDSCPAADTHYRPGVLLNVEA
ncbi:hypothetical protein [Burkholderia ubonensis]|uniref:hypothetical protein n=1 Tax=Burkholderia ubonensis TaxID=101571 RepID=UPI000B30B382|nr:hypothetical protein [Burkholderia ubonensis]